MFLHLWVWHYCFWWAIKSENNDSKLKLKYLFEIFSPGFRGTIFFSSFGSAGSFFWEIAPIPKEIMVCPFIK